MHNNPYNVRGHNPALHQAIHASQTALKMSHHSTALAMKQSQQSIATARKMAALARAASRRGGPRGPRPAAATGHQPASGQRVVMEQLRNQLRMAVTEPLVCRPQRGPNGERALFFEANWTSPDGFPHVVMACNTRLPGSGNLAAAMLLTKGEDFVHVDLQVQSVLMAVARGKLFLFTSSVRFPDDECYAVCPANYCEQDGGPPGLVTFATAGTWHGHVFTVDRSGLGSFVDGGPVGVAVARPVRFDESSGVWTWVGRSSDRQGSALRFYVEASFQPDPSATTSFMLPALSATSDLSAIRCTQQDDQGDPLAIVDTRLAPHAQIMRIKNRLFLVAQPNQQLPDGSLWFAQRESSDGSGIADFHFDDAGRSVVIELEARHVDASGGHWFLRRANARDKLLGNPLVVVGLNAT